MKRPVDEYDLGIARDVGEMKADIRTIKHDMVGFQQQMMLLDGKLSTLNTEKAKGLGFFAGAAFIVTTFGGILLVAAKALFGSIISGVHHP